MLMHYILWEKMMEGCLLEEFFNEMLMGIKNQQRTGDMSWAWGAWDERWACLRMVHPMGHRHTKGNVMRNHMLGSVVFFGLDKPK